NAGRPNINSVRTNVNTGRININSARTNVNTGRTNINSVKPNVNTGRTNVNPVRPRVNTGSSNVNTVRYRQPVPNKTSNNFSPKRPQGNWGSAVKTSAGYNWRPTRPNSNCNSGPTFIRTDHPLKNMVDRGIFDNGCLGHMTVCACSRFQVTPKTSHLNAIKRIFRYLKGKPNLGLLYPRESSFNLEAYSDSNYAGPNLDRKSTTGGCQFLGSRLISW
ncbi:hypothetical protein Tco_0956352, partial [Tanacetum coccineum]